MNRRRLLAWLGSAGLLGLAGCSDEAEPQSGPTSPGGQPTASPSPSVSPTPGTASDSPSATRSESPTGTEPDTATETPTDTEPGTDTATDTPEGTDSPTPDGETETASETPATDRQRTVSLASVDSVPAAHEVEMDATLLRSTVSDARTARLRITTTNTGSPRSISVARDDCGLLNRSKGGSDRPGGLWLHDPEEADRIDRDGDRWEADRDADEPRVYADYGCPKREYAAGESLSNEYVLWSDYRVEGYMEPGTYRWEEEVSVSEGETPTGTAAENTFTWGFSLSVRAP